MRVIVDGRRAGKGNRACYFENKAYFTRKGLTKRTVLHEFYHHLVDVKGWDLPSMSEENDANRYAREFLKSQYSKDTLRIEYTPLLCLYTV